MSLSWVAGSRNEKFAYLHVLPIRIAVLNVCMISSCFLMQSQNSVNPKKIRILYEWNFFYIIKLIL